MIRAAANRKWKVVIYNWETGFLNPVPFWLKASVCQCIFCHTESYCFWNHQTCNETYKMVLFSIQKYTITKWVWSSDVFTKRFFRDVSRYAKTIKVNSRKIPKYMLNHTIRKNMSPWSDIFGKMISLVNPYRVHLIETTTAFIQPTKCDGASWQIF